MKFIDIVNEVIIIGALVLLMIVAFCNLFLDSKIETHNLFLVIIFMAVLDIRSDLRSIK